MTNELLTKMEKNKRYVKWKTTPLNLENYEVICGFVSCFVPDVQVALKSVRKMSLNS